VLDTCTVCGGLATRVDVQSLHVLLVLDNSVVGLTASC
jgi:hypothetical protein